MCQQQSMKIGRREFLAVTGGAAAGIAARTVLATDQQEAAWTMPQSTSSIHYTHLPIEKACEQIARSGFEGVDVWSAHAGCPHLDDVRKRLGPDGLKEILAETKLTSVSPANWCQRRG